MPRLPFVPLFVLAACTSSEMFDPPPATVRDRLTTDGADLAVAGDHSTGSIVARLWSANWEDYAVELALGGGEVAVSADAVGGLRVDELALDLAPIDLSARVFDEPTRLVDLHVALAADAPVADTTWHDANSAAATTSVTLRLEWSLEVGDRVTPLGPLVLANLPLALTVAGDTQHVEAALALHADGTLWSWAGLIELGDLSLDITAR
jgi:hypothetical protein